MRGTYPNIPTWGRYALCPPLSPHKKKLTSQCMPLSSLTRQFPFISAAKKKHPQCTKTHLFELKNRKFRRGHPLPTLYALPSKGAFGASILAPTALDTRAFGARPQSPTQIAATELKQTVE